MDIHLVGAEHAPKDGVGQRAKLSEYHTGYRAYSRELLASIPFDRNSDDFVFDNQILAQILWQRKMIGEVTCTTKYSAKPPPINFRRSLKYGLGCVYTTFRFRLAKMGVVSAAAFAPVRACSSHDFITTLCCHRRSGDHFEHLLRLATVTDAQWN